LKILFMCPTPRCPAHMDLLDTITNNYQQTYASIQPESQFIGYSTHCRLNQAFSINFEKTKISFSKIQLKISPSDFQNISALFIGTVLKSSYNGQCKIKCNSSSTRFRSQNSHRRWDRISKLFSVQQELHFQGKSPLKSHGTYNLTS